MNPSYFLLIIGCLQVGKLSSQDQELFTPYSLWVKMEDGEKKRGHLLAAEDEFILFSSIPSLSGSDPRSLAETLPAISIERLQFRKTKGPKRGMVVGLSIGAIATAGALLIPNLGTGNLFQGDGFGGVQAIALGLGIGVGGALGGLVGLTAGSFRKGFRIQSNVDRYRMIRPRLEKYQMAPQK